MKQLLLVDDHQIILDGLAHIIEEAKGITIADQVRSGQQALEVLARQPIDILCIDIEMPGLSGIEVAKVVKKKYPTTKVLVLTMHNTPAMVQQVSDIGVDGFLKKDAGKLEFLLALEQLANNDTYYSQQFTTALIEANKASNQQIKLTPREQEVLRLLTEGLNTGDIADRLCIATHTVQSHRKNLLSKFGLNNTPALIHKATRLGFITVD